MIQEYTGREMRPDHPQFKDYMACVRMRESIGRPGPLAWGFLYLGAGLLLGWAVGMFIFYR